MLNTQSRHQPHFTTGLSLHHPHIIKTYCASMYTEATTRAYRIQPLVHSGSCSTSGKPTITPVPHGPQVPQYDRTPGSCDPSKSVGSGVGQTLPDGGHFAHIVMELCPLGSLRQMLDGRALLRTERGNYGLDMDEVCFLGHALWVELRLASEQRFNEPEALFVK